MHSNIEVKRGLLKLITIHANPSMSSIPNFIFVPLLSYILSRPQPERRPPRVDIAKSTLIELQEQTISEILQQTASVITEERLQIKNLANFAKMNAIQADEKGFSFLNSPTVFEKVGPTISKWFYERTDSTAHVPHLT